MACGRLGILPAIFNKKNQVESSRRFLENGSMLLEDLIAFSNGRYDIPIRRFSVEELSQATNGFCSDGIVIRKSWHTFCTDGTVIEKSWYTFYKGSFEERAIFIKKYHDDVGSREDLSRAKSGSIRDLVMMAVMSNHKNVLKVLGCCLDFEIPALVCEYAAGTSSSSIKLSSLLYKRNRTGTVNEENGSILTWKTRLKVANEIANVVVYMHTAFPTPIIHRDLRPDNIIVDHCGVARLSDFSLSISIPPGETQVEVDRVVGIYGFMAPEYVKSGTVNEKSDVYGFGMILFGLLTGKRASELNPLLRNFAECSEDSSSDESSNEHLKDYFRDKNYEFLYGFDNMDQLNNVVDPTILHEEGGGMDVQDQQQQLFRAFAALALRCVQENSEDRPEMITVAKELRRIMLKSVCPSS